MCCCEIDSIVEKKGENESDITCIINHDGFNPVCLDVWVLQMAYTAYKHRYGEAEVHQ